MIVTGSGGDRFMHCLGSSVLPRAYDEREHEYRSRGREVHAYLQRINEGATPEDSLGQVEAEEHRGACSAIEVEQIRDVLGLTAEIALAYNPVADTARVLGVGLEREYEAAGVDPECEIPLTLDVAGLNRPERPTIGFLADYKTGWQRIAPARRNWQIRTGGVALARAFDLDEVRGQLIHLRDGVPVYRDHATFTAAELAEFAWQLRARWELGLRARAEYRAGVEPEVTRGPWCRYCPSYNYCGATVALVRAAAGGELELSAGVTPETIAQAFKNVRDAKEMLKRVEAACYAAAHERPVLLERLEDGTEIWLGMTEVIGNEKIDAQIAREVVAAQLGEEAIKEAFSFELVKGRLETAIKARVPRGAGAEKMRSVLGAIRARGGAQRPVKHEVDVYRLAPQQLKRGT